MAVGKGEARQEKLGKVWLQYGHLVGLSEGGKGRQGLTEADDVHDVDARNVKALHEGRHLTPHRQRELFGKVLPWGSVHLLN